MDDELRLPGDLVSYTRDHTTVNLRLVSLPTRAAPGVWRVTAYRGDRRIETCCRDFGSEQHARNFARVVAEVVRHGSN